MNRLKVLINLHRGYGLGDGAQMSAVLRHIAKYRPYWDVDYLAEEGKHQVGRGILQNTFAYGTTPPSDHYDAEVQILLFDTFSNWGDRPNTRVSSCLHERFGLPWDPECGRYQVQVSPAALKATGVLIPRPGRTVALHYRGDSSPAKKDLTHAQAVEICKAIEGLGYTPLLLDWRNASPLPDGQSIRTTGRLPMSKTWGGDAEMNCAVIRQCAAFVGIDSGPSKCASATETPALVVWTGHHPAPFHDPAPNTTHLAPRGYHGLEPVCNDPGVIRWFEAHHNVRQYQDDPVKQIRAWLEETLA